MYDVGSLQRTTSTAITIATRYKKINFIYTYRYMYIKEKMLLLMMMMKKLKWQMRT